MLKPAQTQPLDNPCRPRHFKPDPCAPAAADGPLQQTLEIGRTRLLVAGALFALAFLVIGLRVVDLSLIKGGEKSGGQRVAKVETGRADIVDRNGVLIATTLASPSLFANPRHVLDAKDAAKRLAAVLPDLSEAELLAKLTADKSFVWLKRHLTPRQQFEVNRLGVPGLYFEREERRVYPHGALAAHVVGYAGIDGKGLAGVERSFDEVLRGSREKLQLTIDVRLQHILHEELSRAVDEFDAIGGAGLVLDVRTGEVLAMISLPDFDPNKPGTATPETIFNRATLGIYEMGSTFKIFNTALALDARTATMSSGYDATHPVKYGRFTIEDYHGKKRWLTVPEIFMYSSNIGSVRMALDAGLERQKEFLGRLGLLKAPSFEVPEIGAPLVPSPWREINGMTIAFGHGLSVSPLQMASAVSAVVNGGVLFPATLIKHPEGYVPAGQQVLSSRTSADMRRLLRLVVDQGTGTKAAAPGYLVGGKTGTAEKVSGKSYAKKALLSSFVGAFPINEPRYAVFVMIDEPHGNAKTQGYATGGWTAAPVVGRFVSRMAPLMGLKPIDEEAPEIRRGLWVDLPGQVKKVAAN